jgi:hypothetical protein
MINLLLLNKLDIIISICLVIISFYFLRKFFIPVKKNNLTDINNGDDDDDIPFRSNVDKRSLRPSYARFMRRKLQQELNNESYLCVICWNDRKSVVLLPCKHLCVCVSCRKKLWNSTQNETCPICRNQVDNLLEVFT